VPQSTAEARDQKDKEVKVATPGLKEQVSPVEGSDKTSSTQAKILVEEAKKEEAKPVVSGMVKPPSKPTLKYRSMPHITQSVSYLKYVPKVYPEQLNFDWNECDYMVTHAARKALH